MAYTSNYHDDSDEDYEASDEHERSVIQSPTIPIEYPESSPTSSGPMSTEHTPTTFTHARDAKGSPTGLITEWTKEHVADFVAGLGLRQYADTFIGMHPTPSTCQPPANCQTEHEFSGEVLVEVQHAELKEIGLHSVGHRLTILKAVYEIKVKQNVPIEPDHYVPLCMALSRSMHHRLLTARQLPTPPPKMHRLPRRTLPR